MIMLGYPDIRDFMLEANKKMKRNVKKYFCTIRSIKDQLSRMDVFMMERMVPRLSPLSIINLANGIRLMMDPREAILIQRDPSYVRAILGPDTGKAKVEDEPQKPSGQK